MASYILITSKDAQKTIKDFFSKYDQIRSFFYWRNPLWKTSFFVQCKFLCCVRGRQVLQNHWEILVKEFYLRKFGPHSLQMQQKWSLSQIVFKGFACFLGTANLRKNSFLFKGYDHIHGMHNCLSETLCSQFFLGVVLKSSLNVLTEPRKW